MARKATTPRVHRDDLESVPRVQAPRHPSGLHGGAVPSRNRQRLIIIGNGMVSHRLCARLMDYDPGRYQITVFSEERLPAYDRVHLGEVLSGRDPRSLLLATEEWYRDHQITLRLGDPVVGLDLSRRIVRSARGVQLEYDRLVLATGSVPVTPTIKIDDWSRVFVLRTAEDVGRVRAGAQGARSAVVVGGGLLGLETASTLRDAGLELTVLERNPYVMQPHLELGAAVALREMLEERGIAIALQTTVTSIEQDGPCKRLLLTDGRTLLTDFVVLATGARPRDNLGAWGIATHARGGFVVNDLLQTSDPAVFAVGECAVFGDRPFGTVAPGYVMAECLAQSLVDRAVRFRPPAPSVRLKIAGLPVAVAGAPDSESVPTVVAHEGEHRTLRVKNGELVGATAVGPWRDWERVEDAVRRKRPVSHWRIERFTRGESLWPDEPSATGRPDEQLICTCNRVDYGTICGAIRGGCRSVADIAARTGATRTCGSCVPVIERILELDAPPLQAPRRSVALPVLGVLALLATALLVAARPLLARWLPRYLPFWDELWRAPLAQQITGFATVGLVALALILPLRRKLKRFPGGVTLWRVVHTAVGALAIAALAAHTGLRLGMNLNLFLTIGFLSLAGVGGLTTFWPWGHRPPGPVGRALRFIHLMLFWPALALIALHVLVVYTF